MAESENLTPAKRDLESANFIDEFQTPLQEIVEGFANAVTWYRENCVSKASSFPPQPVAVANELIGHDIDFTTLVKMVLRGLSSCLMSPNFDAYSVAKFGLWVKSNYTLETFDAFQAENVILSPIELSKPKQKKTKTTTPKNHAVQDPQVPLRIAKLDGDLGFLESKKNLKKAYFTYPGIDNLAMKTLSRSFGVVRALKDDGLSGTVVLTSEMLKTVTGCGGDIFARAKNIVTCALLDHDFLTTTIAAEKAKEPSFRKALKNFRTTIDDHNKEKLETLAEDDIKKDYLQIAFPHYLSDLGF